MNQQHFPGGAVVPPFLPPGSVPPHARVIGYPMQPSGVVAPGGATNTPAHAVKEDKSDERVSWWMYDTLVIYVCVYCVDRVQ